MSILVQDLSKALQIASIDYQLSFSRESFLSLSVLMTANLNLISKIKANFDVEKSAPFLICKHLLSGYCDF